VIDQADGFVAVVPTFSLATEGETVENARR
jgi:hypothetical protein